jgi:hypothetical protein
MTERAPTLPDTRCRLTVERGADRPRAIAAVTSVPVPFGRPVQALRTFTLISPTRSIVQRITSPSLTGPTPSGVPVMITSPG